MSRRGLWWPTRWRAEARAPSPAPAPTPRPEAPDARIQVDVTAAVPRRPWRVGRTAWRGLMGGIDLALLALVLGVVAWALGQLALRHLLPANAFTAWLAQVSQWEGRWVVGLWQRGGAS